MLIYLALVFVVVAKWCKEGIFVISTTKICLYTSVLDKTKTPPFRRR